MYAVELETVATESAIEIPVEHRRAFANKRVRVVLMTPEAPAQEKNRWLEDARASDACLSAEDRAFMGNLRQAFGDRAAKERP